MNQVLIKPLSIERFEAFIAYSRNPRLLLFAEELEYWTDSKERVIGLILFDKTDKDYSIMLLARDEIKRFRAICWRINIKNIDEARESLFDQLAIWANKKDEDYYQFDVTREVKNALASSIASQQYSCNQVYSSKQLSLCSFSQFSFSSTLLIALYTAFFRCSYKTSSSLCLIEESRKSSRLG